jgi:hypothetical protein
VRIVEALVGQLKRLHASNSVADNIRLNSVSRAIEDGTLAMAFVEDSYSDVLGVELGCKIRIRNRSSIPLPFDMICERFEPQSLEENEVEAGDILPSHQC